MKTSRWIVIFLLLLSSASSGQASADLAAEIRKVSDRLSGKVGVAARHLTTGEEFFLNGTERFPMASVYKAPIAIVLLRSDLSLSEIVELREADLRPGHSPLVEEVRGRRHRYTIGELLRRMAGESDNTASDYLMKRLGGPAKIAEVITGLRVEGVEISRYETDLIADASGFPRERYPDPFDLAEYERRRSRIHPTVRAAAQAAYAIDKRDSATPKGIADLFARLETGTLLPPQERTLLLEILTTTKTGPERLKKLLPRNTTLAHKTGSMPGTTNDVGIVTLPDGSKAVMAVLIRGDKGSSEEREKVIADIGRLLFDHFASGCHEPAASR